MLQVIVTEADLTPVGQPISTWTSIDVTQRFNTVALGQVVVPLTRTAAQLLAPGRRISIIRDGDWFAGGPIERPGEQRYSRQNGGTLTIGFGDDLALPAARAVYPDPAWSMPGPPSVARREFAAVNAELAIRSLFDENAGPTALPDRQVAGLTIGAAAGVGDPVTIGFRLEALLDACRTLALAGGGLGFRVVQVGGVLELQVYQPLDLTEQVRFSIGLGNLLDYTYLPEAPTVTAALVGDGSGTGASRDFIERVSAAAATWGRMEKVVSKSDTTNTTELELAGDAALAEGVATASLTALAVDTPSQRYGEHYRLGDVVSVELFTGDVVSDVVRAVRLIATPDDGEVLSPLIGTQGATTDPQWRAITRQMQQDVLRLAAV